MRIEVELAQIVVADHVPVRIDDEVQIPPPPRTAAVRVDSRRRIVAGGSGTGAEFEEIVGRRDLESSVSHVMDYLTMRDDVDEHRIALVGDSAGSSFVARGVALDNRFAAAVCDGGLWDMHEHAFLMNRLLPDGSGSGGVEGSWPGLRFHCPVLITVGGQGWLKSSIVADLFERLKTHHRDISLKIFDSSETAAAQGHHDNPTLANEFIFDWVADRLDRAPA